MAAAAAEVPKATPSKAAVVVVDCLVQAAREPPLEVRLVQTTELLDQQTQPSQLAHQFKAAVRVAVADLRALARGRLEGLRRLAQAVAVPVGGVMLAQQFKTDWQAAHPVTSRAARVARSQAPETEATA
jgi:hypothetical protein